MHAIRIRTRLKSPLLGLEELAPLLGRDVEIIVLAPSDVTLATDKIDALAMGGVWIAPDFDDPIPEIADYR